MSTKDTFKLYNFFYSSASQRVRTVLNLKKIDYKYIPINLTQGEQNSEDYRKLNSNNTVPTLVINDNIILKDSVAIIEYLDAKYTQCPQLPKDLILQAYVRGICQVINAKMQPLQNLRVAKKVQEDYGESREKWTVYWVTQGFESLEEILSEKSSKYCLGDQITMADCFLYPQAFGNSKRFGVDLSKYKNVNRVYQNLQQVEEFIQAEPQNQIDFPK